jgi:hypothetical protein
MTSETVYQVAKVLPIEEQILLFEKLKKDFSGYKKNNCKARHLYDKEDANSYLLANIFSKKYIID